MQVPTERHGELHTFAVFNKRLRVTSSAKRRRAPGSTVLAQTPDGSFRDLMRNARELLLDHCGFTAVPEVKTSAGLPTSFERNRRPSRGAACPRLWRPMDQFDQAICAAASISSTLRRDSYPYVSSFGRLARWRSTCSTDQASCSCTTPRWGRCGR